MDIRSSLDGLRSLLGVNAGAPASTQRNTEQVTEGNLLASDRATLSSAGSEVSQTASDSGVRMDKVQSVQAALGTGSYEVPASAVASKVVDAMLGNGPSSN
jgi:negative regulator of flagellin synthesis FlgM